ncbi:MFS transporter [Cohnella lubricantis]|uniref:MFS transporter n=1 Tax=Cohnella lubricantis TaxID=2163172 RepID=A0A841TDG2_9BACL|nr:MFS transporter [Cohnella lubricantis]MBB6678065.1 MFS transporter [Cohnella lubricantis]MBP2120043.1 Na+/melibiose symporter-like transporter [Cohnella lubricantis]
MNIIADAKRESGVRAASAWRNRNFTLLYLSGAAITLGSKVYELALPLILYDLTRSEVAMTTMRAIEFLPNLLLAIFIGVWVDRANKKRWIQTTNLLQAVFLLLLFFLLEAGHHSLWIFYSIGFLLMTLNYSYGNGRISLAKQALPRELLTTANAKFSAVSTFADIMGPALSGFILLLANLNFGLLFTAIAFAVAFGITAMLPADQEAAKQARSSFWSDLREGWVELRRNRPLWMLTWLVVFLNSASGLYDAVLIFYAKDTLGLSDLEVGLLLCAGGAGGLIGSQWVTSLRSRLGTGKLLGLTLFMSAVASILLYFAHNATLMAVSLFVSGLFGLMQSVCIWSFRQESTPTHLIGRISGVTGSMFKLGLPFVLFGSGFAAHAFGASLIFLLAVVFYLAILVVYRFLPLWRLP